jgi:hypothetical protein
VQRHLSLFLSDVRAKAPVPTLRSFLKLYTSLDANKLANFLDADEEEMVQQLMVMKQASRGISRLENERGLLGGQMISTSDLDFVIDEVSTVVLYHNFRPRTYMIFIVFFCARCRIWSTSPSPQLEGAMQAGSSETPSTPNAFSKPSGMHLSPAELHPRLLSQKTHPRTRLPRLQTPLDLAVGRGWRGELL